jgi:ribosome-associated toxin RatA of RatAB toxin-antitoxin module
MPLSKWNLEVECAIEDAFEYVADWRHYKDFIPFFLDLKVTSAVEYGPGTSFETTVALGKVEIVTEFSVIEFLKNKRILLKAYRGVKSKAAWDFKQVPRKTLVSFSFEYEIPPGLVSRPHEREAIEKELQEHADNSMNLLKWVLESLARKQQSQ